jgi:hypothetical protein
LVGGKTMAGLIGALVGGMFAIVFVVRLKRLLRD